MHAKTGLLQASGEVLTAAVVSTGSLESAISPSWQPRLQGFGQEKRFLSAGCREGCPGKRFLSTSWSICLSTSTACSALPALLTTTPLGAIVPPWLQAQAPAQSELAALPMPQLPTSLPATCCPPPCTGSPEHTLLHYCPSIRACVCPEGTPALAGAALGHRPAVTKPLCCLPHALSAA